MAVPEQRWKQNTSKEGSAPVGLGTRQGAAGREGLRALLHRSPPRVVHSSHEQEERDHPPASLPTLPAGCWTGSWAIMARWAQRQLRWPTKPLLGQVWTLTQVRGGQRRQRSLRSPAWPTAGPELLMATTKQLQRDQPATTQGHGSSFFSTNTDTFSWLLNTRRPEGSQEPRDKKRTASFTWGLLQ